MEVVESVHEGADSSLTTEGSDLDKVVSELFICVMDTLESDGLESSTKCLAGGSLILLTPASYEHAEYISATGLLLDGQRCLALGTELVFVLFHLLKLLKILCWHLQNPKKTTEFTVLINLLLIQLLFEVILLELLLNLIINIQVLPVDRKDCVTLVGTQDRVHVYVMDNLFLVNCFLNLCEVKKIDFRVCLVDHSIEIVSHSSFLANPYLRLITHNVVATSSQTELNLR